MVKKAVSKKAPKAAHIAGAKTDVSPSNPEPSKGLQRSNYFSRFKNWVSFLTLIFVGAYTYITFESYVSGNRAFVYFDKATFEVVDRDVSRLTGGSIFNLPGSAGKVVSVRFALNNAGNTATKNARVIIDCRPIGVRDLKRKEPFLNFEWTDDAAIPEIIGPKQTIEVGPCEIPFENILNAQTGIEPIYFTGEIRYQDRVWSWSNHVTRFSQELAVVKFDETKGLISAQTRSVGHNNCADEDCKQ